MKKVGILTFNKANNAGAMLQLYSFYKIFEENSFEPQVINYNCKRTYVWQYPKLIKGYYPNFQYLFDLKNHLKFKKFKHLLATSKEIQQGCINKIDNNFDYVFIGSDQVFNMNITGHDFTYINYFDIKSKNGVYGYSVSFGNYSPLNSIQFNCFRDGLNNFKKVSFREKDFIEKLNFKFDAPVTCDPTLLHDEKFWNDFSKLKRHKRMEKFIYLYYANEFVLEEAIKYAKKNNCKIFYSTSLVKMPNGKLYKRVSDNPIDFVNYIKYADYVFTSSFHGLIFSLIFRKNVYLPISDNGRFGRMRYMINKYNINGITKKELIGKSTVDFDSVHSIIRKERQDSLNYIQECLNGKYFK